jgi:transposase
MHVEDHVGLAELKRLARAEKHAKLSKRIQMIVLAIEGYTAPAIAQSVGISRRVCQQWVQRFNQEGLDGLQDKSGRGKPPLLTPAERERLKQRIDAGPTVEDSVCTLRGKDIQRILEEEFGKVRSLDAVYYLLHQLGYSSLMPRPQHRKADPEAQAHFKKSSRGSWQSSRPKTRQTLEGLLSG